MTTEELEQGVKVTLAIVCPIPAKLIEQLTTAGRVTVTIPVEGGEFVTSAEVRDCDNVGSAVSARQPVTVDPDGLACPNCGGLDFVIVESGLFWRPVDEIDLDAKIIFIGDDDDPMCETTDGFSCGHCYARLELPEDWTEEYH
jgi:hypothetical protein